MADKDASVQSVVADVLLSPMRSTHEGHVEEIAEARADGLSRIVLAALADWLESGGWGSPKENTQYDAGWCDAFHNLAAELRGQADD